MPKRTKTRETGRRAAGRLAGVLLLALAGLPPAVSAPAAPSGEQVISGEGVTFDRSGNTTTIGTQSDLTIVEYQSFDILAGEVVRIDQPDASSRFLNRVPHGDPTRVDGSLSSNGFVYILNPAGVFLGNSAVVDVSGLVAGAGSLSNQDFLARNDRFTDLTGDVEVAEGAEVTADQMVALVGRRVASFGAIRTEGGMIALVAGENATLAKVDGRVVVRVDPGAAPDPGESFALTQGGTLDAGTGRVSLTAGDAYSLALNHDGITRGREIELEAGGDGLVQVAGLLDASARGAGETGGRVQVTGDRIALDGAKLDASGAAGGGEIRVGGDRGGEGPLRRARRTWVDGESELVADAIERGDGGEIVVWSDEKTGFYGLASARGGQAAGDGGFVEISGRSFLASRGLFALDAPHGESGTLLYDPLEIEIVGSGPEPSVPLDGSDVDLPGETNEELLVGAGGARGQILSGQFTAQDDPVPFVVFESELEGTEANIVLEAQQRVYVSGTFLDKDMDGTPDVFLLPGNDLTIATTSNSASGDEAGIDLTLAGDLAWHVSDGGTILLTTSSGSVDEPSDAVFANIKAGTLVFGGRAYRVEEALGLSLALTTQRTAVAVSTLEGDIEVAEIRANGDDSRVVPASGSDPEEVRLASTAGGVSVTAQSGDIRLGSVQANGGDDMGSVSPGGGGGAVVVTTEDGDIEIGGGIEARGGSGRAGYRAGQAIFATGGAGGEIIVEADRIDDTGPKGRIDVLGDLLADGGDAVGVFSDPELGSFAAVGGTGGRVEVNGQSRIEMGAVTIDASAGGGSGAGGAPTQFVRGEFASVVDAIQVFTPLLPEGSFGGEIALLGTRLVAEGGAAGIQGGPGGAGGAGGNVLVQAGTGAVSGDVEIVTSGGDGGFGLEGPAARAGFGGAAGVVNVSGRQGAFVGNLVAEGGLGVNGTGGAGGPVLVSSTDGSVLVNDIRASGGDASEDIEVLEGIAGGAGSTNINLSTGDGAVDSDAGSVFVLGTITAFGGAGQDADGDVELANAGFLTIDADAVAYGDPGSLLQVGVANVTGRAIDGIRVGGTPRDDDRATLTAEGQIDAVLSDSDPQNALESLTIVQRSIAAQSSLTRSNGDAMLHASGDADTRVETVDLMASQLGDPSLDFVLDEVIPVPDDGSPSPSPARLVIEAGAVALGSAGGGITNGASGVGADNDGAIEGEDAMDPMAPPHVTSLGDFLLDGRTIGFETPVRVEGASDAALRLVASGRIDVEVEAAFGALDVTQGRASGASEIQTSIALPGAGESVTIHDEGGVLTPVSRIDATTDASFAYHLVAGPAEDEPTAQLPDVALTRLHLGGSGLIESPGDIHVLAPQPLDDATVLLADTGLADLGNDLSFVAAGGLLAESAGVGKASIDLGGTGDPDDPADLLVQLGGSFGEPGAEVTTRNLERVAGRFQGGFHLRNLAGGDLRIATAPVLDPSDLSPPDPDAPAATLAGLISTTAGVVGDVAIANEAGAIVLGEVDAGTGAVVHVASTGGLSLEGPVLVDNARFVSTAVDDGLGGTTLALRPRNEATLIAQGDIELGEIDTAPGATAVDDRPDLDPGEQLPDTLAAGELLLSSQGGTVTLRGDVGSNDVLARLDTTAMELEGDRSLRAGELIFRGTLDGAGHASLVGELPAGSNQLASRVSFGGDVGTKSPLQGLDVEADEIRFSLAPENGTGSANRVVVAGDVHLDTRQTTTPQVATIVDTSGGLSIDAQRFEVEPNEKVSVTGTLALRADTVRVSDLSASRLRIDSPQIQVMLRDAAPVALADGSTVVDDGVDWVANEIVLSSVPELDPQGNPAAPPPTLVLGSGGLTVPGSPTEFRVRRFSPQLDAVTAASFAGADGSVLDLRGTGGAFAGDPSRQLPRREAIALPDVPARKSGAPAAAAPRVSGPQALAFLHCGAPGPIAPGCSADELTRLRSFAGLEDSALGTPRAQEIHERYRALLTAPGAPEQLRALFDQAGRAYGARREWNDGTIDGGELVRFLRASRERGRPALEAVRELAWLLAEIELLGLDESDTRRLQDAVARDFAEAAGLPGLTPKEARAAAEATSVRLPGPPAFQ